MGKIVRRILGIAFFILLFSVPSRANEVNISAAASLRDVLNELAETFCRLNPGAKLLPNYGGSGSLAKQIENGAPADLFISANRAWMDYLRGRGLMENTSIRPFAYNSLVFVGEPTGKVATLRDLLSMQRIAIGSPGSVPAGEYALQALRNAGMERSLEKKLVMAKDVRECLMYAERGEVDGAFVYLTDALLTTRVRILIKVPQELYPRVTYPMGLTLQGAGNSTAAAFYQYLESESAKSVLTRFGFAGK